MRIIICMIKSIRRISITLFIVLLQGFIFNVQTLDAAFSDVPQTHKYIQGIQYLENLGIAEGETFKPDEQITREDYAKWLLRNVGFSDENYKKQSKIRLTDVKKLKNPYAPYIYKLVDLGVIEFGKGKTTANFQPEKPITRQEAIKWLFKVEGVPIPLVFDEMQFQATDVKTKSPLAPIINKAIGLGIIKGGRISPLKKVTRAEAAHFLKTVKNASNTLTVNIVPFVKSDLEKNSKYEILASVWNKILESYLRRNDLSRDQMMYGAIEGVVKELNDKHTDFERPGNNALIESLSGQVEGIGAVVQMKDELVEIVTPIKNSPAEKAGLLANDLITHVDDVSVKGMTLTKVVSRIKGKKGTQVKLTIKRGAEILNFTITRDIVEIVSASMTRTDDNIAVIELTDFGSRTLSEFSDVVKNMEQNRPKGIVLDMRNNPGGFLTTCVQIAGYFIKNGDKVVTVRYPDSQEAYNSSGNAELASYKIAVLVNGGSASAAEILAGALQDYKLAQIIGMKTFGKGTVQELSDFTDGSTLKLTVAEWLTPLNHLIEKNGITPDIEVKLTAEDRTANRDPQLDKALEELRK